MVHETEQTYHLHLTGQVQGVGFRPFVWRLARAMGLRGWVNNTSDGVHVAFNATEEGARAFASAIVEQAPALARITGRTLSVVAKKDFAGFEIVHSESGQPPNLLLTPDFALCDDCRRELHDPANRRFGYAFITCTNCGPRFSIATGLPYDRERTTMQRFEQCPACRAEYDNPEDRRYYSQTNSCPACGIRLQFQDAGGTVYSEPLETAVAWLLRGKILAVKGVGGYLLLCDATRAETVKTLRTRKQRPDKPFALLYGHAGLLEGDVWLKEEEKALLTAPEAPILLLPLRPEPPSGICLDQVAPGLAQIGAMLPYAPLLDLIAQGVGKPLVATSGNLSGSPIVYRDEQAREDLSAFADGILSHNRDIVVPQDDSVVRFSPVHAQKIWLRRSRGLAPTFLLPKQPEGGSSGKSRLAMGAAMKSAFAWQHQGNHYVSQYLGVLDNFDTQEAYDITLQHFQRLLKGRPGLIIVDEHPDYFSTVIGRRLAEAWSVPVLSVQHHRAHFAAVLAENGYFLHDGKKTEPVLGVIWDGLGYGENGEMWGGEFFRFDGVSMDRVGWFEPFDFLLGDKMSREPRLSALSLCRQAGWYPESLKTKFTDQERDLYQRMLDRGDLLRTTSVGRLFDGVASLLGLLDVASFEGQAAMLLEQAALSWKNTPDAGPYLLPGTWTERVPVGALIRGILQDLEAGKPPAGIAARFHYSLVEIIRQQARQQGCTRLAFSGGVWQNALLVDLVLTHLGPEFDLLFHRQLSPNDECVGLGQVALSTDS